MKIYLSHSNNFDYKTELYTPLRNSSLNQKHEIILPHETDKYINTKDIIKNSDLVIAEVSFPSTGGGIELGWANSSNTNIICIYKEGKKPSRSLKTVSKIFISYKDDKELINKLSEELES